MAHSKLGFAFFETLFDRSAHILDVNLVLLDWIWDTGYEFDTLFWCDAIDYKNNQFLSVNTYRELLKSVHKKAIEWAHKKGIKTHLHSCGDINPFIPELVEIGLDVLNPIEVKAGMDPLLIKKKNGGDLVLHGGSGTPDEKVVEAISHGIAKVNICTEFVAAFGRAYIATQEQPGFKYSIPSLFEPSKQAGKELARAKIKLFGRIN